MTDHEIYLKGKGIDLRTAHKSDFSEDMVKWIHDKEVTTYLMRGTRPVTVELLQAEFEKFKDTEIQLAIIEKSTGDYIGVVGLHSINPTCHHAEFRILIGEKDHWGKGLGTEALQMISAYAFDVLNLNKVWLGVSTANLRAFNSYKKAGFKKEGVLRQEIYKNGKYYDAARMSLLKSEYAKVKKKWQSK